MKPKMLLLVMMASAGTILRPPFATAQQILHGHVPEAVVRLRLQPIGRLAGTNHLSLAIGLPLRNRESLTNLLQQLYDPASTNYHHYLTPQQFTEAFGPTEQDYKAVIAFAKANNLTVATTHPNRLLLDVSGTVAEIEQALKVTLRVYQHPTEKRTFYAPDTAPSLALTVPVLHISGLDNYALPHPRLKASHIAKNNTASPNTGSGPDGCYMGNDFRAAYVPDSSLTGSGQVVGLLQFDGYTASDIIYYENLAGLPNVTLTNVLLDEFDGYPTGYGDIEVCLDIEMAISMAPDLSQVIVYEAPNGSPFEDIMNRMATDNLARQLSCSWYIPDGRPDATADQIWQEMAAQGQSFFNASGDYGAYTGLISFPGDTPYITQVGGTTLTTSGPGGVRLSETVWNRNNGIASGGGISTSYPIPDWQAGLDMTACQGSVTMRNTPDVALTADDIYVRADGQDYSVGGTSCAAPLWAGFMALVNQQVAAYGRPPAGFINPAIYALAKGSFYGACFHDITTGNNTNNSSPNLYYAVPGYDLCTGWGTPNGANLINALAPPDWLVITPSYGFTSSGNPGGPFSVNSQSLNLTNAGTNQFAWSLSNTSPWLNVSTNGGTLTPGGASATVMVSLSPAASDLPPGVYTATLWFTNLDDSIGQGRTFTLIVLGAPMIAVQPKNQVAVAGGTATFTIKVTGATPLSYTWQRNGSYIPGATNAIYTNNNAQLSDSGSQFCCMVTNAFGAITSSVASLTVFSPPWHLFSGFDGANPAGALVLGSDGNFYGTTEGGGFYGCGTIFRMTTNGELTTLVSFNNANGVFPAAGLVQGSDGNFYGTAEYGGAYSYGTIFRMTANGALTTLVSFNGTNGSIPQAVLVQGSDGNFYGTTSYGGADFNGSVQSGNGTVFRITPNGLLTTLVLFDMTNTGADPCGGLVQAGDGNFYGTTLYGTTLNGPTYGTVFRMTTNGVLTTLVTFNAPYAMDGGAPYAGLVQGNDGNLYGTTAAGGAYNLGTVFRVTTNGLLTTLVSFNGTNGMKPQAALVRGSDGNFYGVTSFGGPYGDGTVFSVASDGTLHTFLVFAGINGFWPTAALVQGSDGNFYGTTFYGGDGYDPLLDFSGNGIVFRLVPPPSPSPPLIVVQPLNQTAVVGDTASFSIIAIGSAALSYSWMHQGALVPGATSATCTLTNVSAADAGSYYAVVTNDYGSVTSRVATLTITALVAAELGVYGQQLVVFFPTTTRTNYTLQITTNPASGNWVTVTNGIPLSGLEIDSVPGPAFFRFSRGRPSVTCLAAGYSHSLFVKHDGSLWAMGNNSCGQLGNGTYNSTNLPEEIVADNVMAMAGGWTHSLFVERDGSLWGMGCNTFGQLGNGAFSTDTPEEIVTTNVTAIAAGGLHTLFIKGDGSLWAMGWNQSGQLGDGTYINTNRPEQIVTSDVMAIAGGYCHSLFLKSDGSLWAMGNNSCGQLGDGIYINTNHPEQIVASNVMAIACGYSHSLFLKSDGSLWAMGDNSYGELGDGSYNRTNRPEQIVASNVTAIAAGNGFSLFSERDGSLWAMGWNQSGQLGNGTYINTNRPEQIMASNVMAIACGYSHSLFLKSDGSLWAMGDNSYGELGDGSYATNFPYGINHPEEVVGISVPVLGIGTWSNQPVVFYPVATATNDLLLITTNLTSGNWAPFSTGIPFSILQIPNVPSPFFFRLY
ncbi:MAG: choice-of-anchor tandem repeat GloVer-containing protein [Verrucomicrobiota bacterium]|jgi:uncharacterized repeat protein (TIGR03803 family)